MSISACDTKVSMPLSLLLANTRVLSCFFFLFLVMLSDFLIIPVVKEKIKVIKTKFALAVPAGAPTMLVTEMIDTRTAVALKTVWFLSMLSKAVTDLGKRIEDFYKNGNINRYLLDIFLIQLLSKLFRRLFFLYLKTLLDV